uniref:Chromosome X open reading frame 65 n=1 Tax=Varanus komodoensis TaxID=61221 RepID=A0A8D2IYX9_VARKO
LFYAVLHRLLANINCSVLLLMHYLRDKVGLQQTDPVDLCEENGTLKLLFLVRFPEDSASKFLTPRGTYYMCKVERGAPGTKHENGYRAFIPLFKYPSPELLDSLRNQCDFLEKSRLKALKSQDGKKPPTMESLLSCMANQVVVSPSRWPRGANPASTAVALPPESCTSKETGPTQGVVPRKEEALPSSSSPESTWGTWMPPLGVPARL